MAKGPSLPLDGRRGLAGDVVDHARDTWHLVHDAPRDVVEKLVRQPRPVRGHEVDRLHRPQRDHVVVAATVAHHAHRAHRQEDREGLTHAIVEIVPAQLLDVDRIRAPQELGVLGAHLAEDPHREPRSGEGVAMGELARQPELGAEPAHLVLEQLAQRLDELETHPLGEPAHVVVRLDDLRLAGARTGKAQVIKSHHNVGGLPERMRLKLVEPLRELFKDEVRRLGTELGLPRELTHRHPFPGPGLAVRILGEVRPEYAELLRRADAIYIEELRRHDLYDRVSQAFAVFLPVRSVGVMGDGRRYDYVIALRAVETVDFMTAHWARLPYEFLDHVSRRIVNEVAGISRVVYDISGKPPATIEWE